MDDTVSSLPGTLTLGHVTLQVSSLARSVEYYQKVLGMRVVDATLTSASLGAQSDDAVLVELREGASNGTPRRASLGLYHFAILLPDRASLGRLVAHLAAIGARAGASDHLVSEALYLSDPDGLGIEIYADRPRDTWRTVNGQLEMASNPLDRDSLLKAANGQPWTGMPSGTSMGHLHLHVGNLVRASAFYHSALGFDKTVSAYPGALFVSAGGYHHHLGLNTWAGPTAQPPHANDARLLAWRIHLLSAEESAAAANRLLAAGFVVESHMHEWIATDPWGTQLHLTHSH